MSRIVFVILCFLDSNTLTAQAPDAALRAEALAGLKKAATFYRESVASHGGFVYYYTPDLKQRWGEGVANADTLFVQPPGTPTVGSAFLTAYAATGDVYYRDAARGAAQALVYGQLQSGGWTQTIHFGPAKRVGKYRNRKGGNWNVSSLDDGQTQAALRMLFHADLAFEFKNESIHDAAQYGLKALLAAQFANGAFPQAWIGPAAKHPILNAKFPEGDWKTTGKIKDYWSVYTLNDNLAGSVADTLIAAHDVYKDDASQAALKKLGDFLILAQMPDPQPGWCQQYGFDMVPVWARKFEPPAVTGWESQDVMETLIRIATVTGDAKYLEPIPKAHAYFKTSLLPDGRVARYYEFKTNKPLYMDDRYQLTYDDAAAPTHYGWKQSARFDAIAKAYEEAKAGLSSDSKKKAKPSAETVRKLLKELDAEGRWISTYAGERLVGQPKFAEGFKYISSEVFSRNVETLSAFLAAK